MLQQRHIEHHGKVGQQGENQIVFHSVRKRLRVVAVTAAVEDQRFVGVAEGLGQNGHKHSYLHAGPVYAQLDTPFLAGKQIWKQNLVGDLIEYAHEAEYEQRPGVGEHTAGKSPVEAVAQTAQLLHEASENHCRTQKVDKEYHTHAIVEAGIYLCQHRTSAEQQRQPQEQGQIEEYVRNNECELEQNELHRLVLLTQAGEHYGLEGIHRHHRSHAGYILWMGGITHEPRYRLQGAEHRHKEKQGDASDHTKGGPVNLVGILALLVGEAEQSRLHSEGKQGEQQGRVAVEIGDYAVAAALRRNPVGVKRYEQVIQKPAHYAAEPIEGRVLDKLFQGVGHIPDPVFRGMQR